MLVVTTLVSPHYWWYKWLQSCAHSCFGLDKHHHGHGQVEAEVSEQKIIEGVVGQSIEHGHSHEQLHAYIGVSLVLGFVFMLLVDQIGSSHIHSSDGRCDIGIFVFLRISMV